MHGAPSNLDDDAVRMCSMALLVKVNEKELFLDNYYCLFDLPKMFFSKMFFLDNYYCLFDLPKMFFSKMFFVPTHKTTTEDDDAATLHHTCILNFFIYLCWVSVEVLTAFLVGIKMVF